MRDVTAQAGDATTQPAKETHKGFVTWKERRGPAYPGDLWHSFGRDAKELPETLWDDTKATFTNKWALIGLTAAAAAGVAIDAADGNGRVADHYARHGSQLNDFWDTVGDAGGNPGTHFALAGALYFTSLARNDVKNYEVSKALINALAINGLTTLALKGVANSESPNGDDFGWPSGHTSSTFCLATVMYEAYGPLVGVPLLGFASFVGYERIDAGNHDFNDVVSGALIGIFIGHVVYQHHQPKIMGMDVIPYASPATGTVGVALAKQW
jgi:acid phosphatase family membrane protein YuiD